jgi:hypothetical protein
MRLIYEKDDKFFKSESGIPEKDGVEIGLTREQVEGYALVYAKNGEIKASATGIPAEDDVILYPVAEVEKEEKDEPVAKEEDTPVEDTEDGPASDLPVIGDGEDEEE